MADFTGDDLTGSRFERVNLSGSEFRAVNLTGSRFLGVALSGSVLRGVELGNVEISGEIENVTINGVDIGPLINAELNKRYPDRATMRPADPAGFREAWDTVERLWDQTVARARRLPPELLHESVDGEWSFTETLRHLAFATDAWIRRAVLGDPAPWHPLDLPWDEMRDTPGVPRDRAARPSLDTVLALRRDRMSTVREFVDGLTDASLAARTEPVDGPGWPPPRSFPVRECLLVVLNEEWEHRLYAERDMAVLEARQREDAGGRPLPAAAVHAGAGCRRHVPASRGGTARGLEGESLDLVRLPAGREPRVQLDVAAVRDLRARRGSGVPEPPGARPPADRMREHRRGHRR